MEYDELMQPVQQKSAQLASLEASARASRLIPQAQNWHQDGLTSGNLSSSQLSEIIVLERERERAAGERLAERERAAERERRESLLMVERERIERADRLAERERAERVETRLVAVGMCTCGLGAAILGVALVSNNKKA